jgi:transcriptional regulator with XRE-family HTH domain
LIAFIRLEKRMLSEALRLLRVYHDMRQYELAVKLGVSKSYISEIENDNRSPSLEVIQKYAEEFKIPVSSIAFFAEQIDDHSKTGKKLLSVKTAIASKVIGMLKLIEERT